MLVVSKLKGGVSCIVFFLFLPFFVHISQMATGWVKTPKSGIANGGVYCDILSFPFCYCGPVFFLVSGIVWIVWSHLSPFMLVLNGLGRIIWVGVAPHSVLNGVLFYKRT